MYSNHSPGKTCSFVAVVFTIIGVLFLIANPAGLLSEKPASSGQYYVPGWKDGCHSGANSFSLFGPLLSDRPFVNDADKVAGADAAKSDSLLDKAGALLSAPQAKDEYKNGWNEGYTVCRFYESALSDFAYFLLIVAALLYKSGRSAKKENA